MENWIILCKIFQLKYFEYIITAYFCSRAYTTEMILQVQSQVNVWSKLCAVQLKYQCGEYYYDCSITWFTNMQ